MIKSVGMSNIADGMRGVDGPGAGVTSNSRSDGAIKKEGDVDAQGEDVGDLTWSQKEASRIKVFKEWLADILDGEARVAALANHLIKGGARSILDLVDVDESDLAAFETPEEGTVLLPLERKRLLRHMQAEAVQLGGGGGKQQQEPPPVEVEVTHVKAVGHVAPQFEWLPRMPELKRQGTFDLGAVTSYAAKVEAGLASEAGLELLAKSVKALREDPDIATVPVLREALISEGYGADGMPPAREKLLARKILSDTEHGVDLLLGEEALRSGGVLEILQPIFSRVFSSGLAASEDALEKYLEPPLAPSQVTASWAAEFDNARKRCEHFHGPAMTEALRSFVLRKALRPATGFMKEVSTLELALEKGRLDSGRLWEVVMKKIYQAPATGTGEKKKAFLTRGMGDAEAEEEMELYPAPGEPLMGDPMVVAIHRKEAKVKMEQRGLQALKDEQRGAGPGSLARQGAGKATKHYSGDAETTRGGCERLQRQSLARRRRRLKQQLKRRQDDEGQDLGQRRGRKRHEAKLLNRGHQEGLRTLDTGPYKHRGGAVGSPRVAQRLGDLARVAAWAGDGRAGDSERDGDGDYDTCDEGDLIGGNWGGHGTIRDLESEGYDEAGDHDKVLDLGATVDVIGEPHVHLSEAKDLIKPVEVDTAGGTAVCGTVGNLLNGSLDVEDGLVLPSCPNTLISLAERLKRGWSWYGSGGTIVLEEPDGEETKEHFFEMNDDLFRHAGTSRRRARGKKGGRRTHKSFLAKAEDPMVDVLDELVREIEEADGTPRPAGLRDGEDDGTARALGGKKAQRTSKMSQALFNLLLVAAMAINPVAGAAAAASMAPKAPRKRTRTQVTAPCEGVGPREHKRRNHWPHDPRCDACRRARMRASKAVRQENPRDVDGAEDGYVIGMDLKGPMPPDVDGNVWMLVATEVGRTDYAAVRLLKTKEPEAVLEAYKDIERELYSMSGDKDVKIVRIHTDRDTAFEGVFGEYIRDQHIRATDTGAFRAKSNSRTETRIRLIIQGMQAVVWQATGGCDAYDALWGPAALSVNDSINRGGFRDGRNPYKALTGKEPELLDNVQPFGERVRCHIVKEHRKSKVATAGDDRNVYLGPSYLVRGGIRVSEVEWDPDGKQWHLSPTKEVRDWTMMEDDYPLKAEAEVQEKTKEMGEFLLKYNLMEYAAGYDSESYQDEEGRDRIYEVERITDVRGRGSKRQYKVKWERYVTQTWEPLSYVMKYGGAEAAEAFEAKRKEQRDQAAAAKVATNQVHSN